MYRRNGSLFDVEPGFFSAGKGTLTVEEYGELISAQFADRLRPAHDGAKWEVLIVDVSKRVVWFPCYTDHGALAAVRKFRRAIHEQPPDEELWTAAE